MTQIVYVHKVKEVVNNGPVGYAEIQAALGLNRHQIEHAIDSLTKQGLVRRLPAINRRRQYIGSAH